MLSILLLLCTTAPPVARSGSTWARYGLFDLWNGRILIEAISENSPIAQNHELFFRKVSSGGVQILKVLWKERIQDSIPREKMKELNAGQQGWMKEYRSNGHRGKSRNEKDRDCTLRPASHEQRDTHSLIYEWNLGASSPGKWVSVWSPEWGLTISICQSLKAFLLNSTNSMSCNVYATFPGKSKRH